MRRKTRLFLMVFASLYLPLALAATPAGRWITVDDKSGKKRAEIELVVTPEGKLHGIIDQTYPEPGDTGVCSHCPGEFKDQPIKGLRFVWDLVEKEHGTWGDGYILDAKTGTIYRVKMTRKGNKLYVRGYIGFSLLGRTQVWVRAT